MSADGSHTDDPEGLRKAPAPSLAARQFAMLTELPRVLAASEQADAALSMEFTQALQSIILNHMREFGHAVRITVPPPSAVAGLGIIHLEEEHKPTFTVGAGPTPTSRGARLFLEDPGASCLYNGRVLNRSVTDLVILRWLDLLDGDPCQRNVLIDKLGLTFTIDKPKSFLLRLDGLLKAGHIFWDKKKRGHFPLLTITPDGSIFCGQLMRRDIKRLSRDQHNCLATYLPWLGLDPIVGDDRPEA